MVSISGYLGDGGESGKGMGGAIGRGGVPRVVHGKGLGRRECAADGAVRDRGRRLRRRRGDGGGHLGAEETVQTAIFQ